MDSERLFEGLQSAWQSRCSNEPAAWKRERAQYIQLFVGSSEFWSHVQDDLPLFSSFFILKA